MGVSPFVSVEGIFSCMVCCNGKYAFIFCYYVDIHLQCFKVKEFIFNEDTILLLCRHHLQCFKVKEFIFNEDTILLLCRHHLQCFKVKEFYF